MHCPVCGAIDTKVADTRLADDGFKIRRRRHCQKCKYRFTTFETIESNFPRVIKSDNSRQDFDINKIRKGIDRALEKLPVSTEKVDGALSNINQRLISLGEKEVSSRQLGEWVLTELRKLNDVAYVRFASVYQSFNNISDFIDMIDKLEKPPEN